MPTPKIRQKVQSSGICEGNPLADSYTRQWLAAEPDAFDLSKPISWWPDVIPMQGIVRIFTQDEAPTRPLLKAGAFKRVTA